MKRGPAPTPTNILKLRGSRRADRPKEPKPPKGPGRCPSWLSKDAKAVWRQMVVILKAMNVLTVADGNALIRYCEYWVRWRKCEEFVRQYGLSFPQKRVVGKGENQTTEVIGFQPFPEATERHRLEKCLHQLEAEFGLTPAARTRIQVEKKPEVAAVRKRERRA